MTRRELEPGSSSPTQPGAVSSTGLCYTVQALISQHLGDVENVVLARSGHL